MPRLETHSDGTYSLHLTRREIEGINACISVSVDEYPNKEMNEFQSAAFPVMREIDEQLAKENNVKRTSDR